MRLLYIGLSLSILGSPVISLGSDIIITEVYYDYPGTDDSYEWVEIYNTTTSPIDLSGHSLGWGGTDYTYGTVQLSGIIPGCTVWVVGGPGSTADNGYPVYDQVINLDPDLQNGGTYSDGVALFDVDVSQIDSSAVPVDVVIYDEPNTSGLMDETGSPGTPEVGDASSGSSIERIDWFGNWVISDMPAPGALFFQSPECGSPMDESQWGVIKVLFK